MTMPSGGRNPPPTSMSQLSIRMKSLPMPQPACSGGGAGLLWLVMSGCVPLCEVNVGEGGIVRTSASLSIMNFTMGERLVARSIIAWQWSSLVPIHFGDASLAAAATDADGVAILLV